MKITVLFFGATANTVGERRINVSIADGSTTQTVFDQMKEQFPKLSSHKLLFSLNQNYATGDEIIRDGDEIAIFTAVSGG